MSVRIIQGNALDLSLPDDSVDLVVTSPPYFGLRSYQDGGEHYSGQVGSEATPAEFVDALIAATREMVRVTKPTGSIWVNLGDKYSGSTGGGAPSASSTLAGNGHRGGGPKQQAGGGRALGRVTPGTPKSLMGLPWRYAIRCIDDLGLILRAEVIWDKPNGLPESVRDRVRRSHEQWFHFTLSPRYYANVDEIREPHTWQPSAGYKGHGVSDRGGGPQHTFSTQANPLGKLPGSVWRIATQPLRVPAELGIDHFAAFPMEWPRRIITGWSPPGICTACGEGRRSLPTDTRLDMSRPQAARAHQLATKAGLTDAHLAALLSVGVSDTGRGAATQTGTGKNTAEVYRLAGEARAALGGYAREYLLRRPTALAQSCACPTPDAPTRPAVVLDPFGGTGTTALVADVLGRDAISVDLSADYCRLAQWRTADPKERARVLKVKGPAKPKPAPEPIEPDIPQDDLFGGAA